MNKELKKAVKEIADVAQGVPISMQEICFELLLKDRLRQLRLGSVDSAPQTSSTQNSAPKTSTTQPSDSQTPVPEVQSDTPAHSSPSGSTEIVLDSLVETDLHEHCKGFLADQKLSLQELNQIFGKSDDAIVLRINDFGTEEDMEYQLVLALLQALKNAMRSGEFQFNGEDVRAEARKLGLYDSKRFAANFNKNRTLFQDFDKYERKSPRVNLSKAGRTTLAAAIKDLV